MGPGSAIRMPTISDGRPADRRVMVLDLVIIWERFSDSHFLGRSERVGVFRQRAQREIKLGETAEKAPRWRISESCARSRDPALEKSSLLRREEATGS